MPTCSDLRPIGLALASAVLLACGPGITEVRQYLSHSPHRAIAVFPLDRQGGALDATPQAAAYLENKLRNYGWSVTGRGKTQVVYSSLILGQS